MPIDLDAQIADACAADLAGWDFSFLQGRVVVQSLPWDYEQLARLLVASSRRLLDIDTGGGEVLERLRPPAGSVAVEPYAPNLDVARARLEPLGVEVRRRTSPTLPLDKASVDLVINRHGAADLTEVARVLQPGGTFLTQQVGADNDQELTDLFVAGPVAGTGWMDVATATEAALTAGLVVDLMDEARPVTTYLDVAAVVYQLRRVPWQVPGWDPVRARDRLAALDARIRSEGGFRVRAHRLLLRAHRP